MGERPEIGFRPLAMADLPLIHRWLNETALVREFYAHGKATSYEKVCAKYGPRIRGEAPTACYMILCDGRPIGLIQTYLWRDYGDLPRTQGLEEESAGLDLFIGEEGYLHRGLGPKILQAFLRAVIFRSPQVESCVLLAEVRNTGALRAYEKAGFRFLRILPDLPGEPGPVWMLRIGRPDLIPGPS